MSFIDKWKDKISEYVDVRVQLIKLSFIDRTSHILGYFVYVFLILSLMLPVLIFLGMGLGELFTNLFDSSVAGYFATVGVYILLIIIIMLCRKPLINAVAGIFIAKLTEDENNEDDHKKII